MKTPRLIQIVILSGLLCAAASGSEESIWPPHKVALWADAGKPYGRVGATIEATKPGRDYRVKSIRLQVSGKEFTVPQVQLRKMQQPRLDTVQIRTGGSMNGGSPWLLLTFRIVSRPASATYSRVYVKFRDGRLRGVDVWPERRDSAG